MRKSISWSYFTATATILLAGILAMGLVQLGLSIRYFSNERKISLTGVVDIVQSQLDYSILAQIEDAQEDRQLLLINRTTDSTLLIANGEGQLLQVVGGTDTIVPGSVLAEKYRAKMDADGDIFTGDTMGGIYTESRYSVGRAITYGKARYYLFASCSTGGLGEYISDMTSTFVLSAGLMILLSSVLSVVFTSRLTAPLRKITEAAQKFGGGDFTTRIAVEGDDEVAQLAMTFNTMAANLAAIDNSRSQFMGNIAHELRTPMTSIKGFIDGMLDGTIPPELQQHYLSLVSEEVGRLARLVQNMLDITKLEAGEYKVNARDYDVWETLTGVVLANEQRIEEGKVQIQGLVPERTQVHADPDLVHQVVYNLMDNALKFTPENGTIRFDVRKAGGMVEVAIENSGVGISEDALPFVFERFYKEDASRGLNAKGSGLGLHICKVLITLSGGSIKVESKQGEWCRFSFTLPESDAPAAPRNARRAK